MSCLNFYIACPALIVDVFLPTTEHPRFQGEFLRYNCSIKLKRAISIPILEYDFINNDSKIIQNVEALWKLLTLVLKKYFSYRTLTLRVWIIHVTTKYLTNAYSSFQDERWTYDFRVNFEWMIPESILKELYRGNSWKNYIGDNVEHVILKTNLTK